MDNFVDFPKDVAAGDDDDDGGGDSGELFGWLFLFLFPSSSLFLSILLDSILETPPRLLCEISSDGNPSGLNVTSLIATTCIVRMYISRLVNAINIWDLSIL